MCEKTLADHVSYQDDEDCHRKESIGSGDASGAESSFDGEKLDDTLLKSPFEKLRERLARETWQEAQGSAPACTSRI